MSYAKLIGFGLLALALAVTGCDKKADPSKADPKKGEEETHNHGKGPNGGVIFDLGDDHAEFTVDHDKKECTILTIKGDNEKAKPRPVAAKEFTVTTKETKTKEGKVVPPLTIKLVAKDEKDGKATKFVGTDPGLGNVAEFAGEVTGLIGGTPAEGKFKE